MLALAALSLTGCAMLPFVIFYNEAGVPIALHLTEFETTGQPPIDLEHRLGVSGRKRVYFYHLQSGWGVTAGRCRLDYRKAVEAVRVNGRDSFLRGQLNVQIEPDFSIHLLSTTARGAKRDHFRDAELPGFPLIPEKTCG